MPSHDLLGPFSEREGQEHGGKGQQEEEEDAEFSIVPVDIGLLGITPNFFLNIHFH